MAKSILMSFPKRVRYRHIQYPPNTAFEVDSNDVVSLEQAGGWIIERQETVAEEPIEQPIEQKKPVTKKAKGATKKEG